MGIEKDPRGKEWPYRYENQAFSKVMLLEERVLYIVLTGYISLERNTSL